MLWRWARSPQCMHTLGVSGTLLAELWLVGAPRRAAAAGECGHAAVAGDSGGAGVLPGGAGSAGSDRAARARPPAREACAEQHRPRGRQVAGVRLGLGVYGRVWDTLPYLTLKPPPAPVDILTPPGCKDCEAGMWLVKGLPVNLTLSPFSEDGWRVNAPAARTPPRRATYGWLQHFLHGYSLLYACICRCACSISVM